MAGRGRKLGWVFIGGRGVGKRFDEIYGNLYMEFLNFIEAWKVE